MCFRENKAFYCTSASPGGLQGYPKNPLLQATEGDEGLSSPVTLHHLTEEGRELRPRAEELEELGSAGLGLQVAGPRAPLSLRSPFISITVNPGPATRAC